MKRSKDKCQTDRSKCSAINEVMKFTIAKTSDKNERQFPQNIPASIINIFDDQKFDILLSFICKAVNRSSNDNDGPVIGANLSNNGSKS